MHKPHDKRNTHRLHSQTLHPIFKHKSGSRNLTPLKPYSWLRTYFWLAVCAVPRKPKRSPLNIPLHQLLESPNFTLNIAELSEMDNAGRCSFLLCMLMALHPFCSEHAVRDKVLIVPGLKGPPALRTRSRRSLCKGSISISTFVNLSRLWHLVQDLASRGPRFYLEGTGERVWARKTLAAINQPAPIPSL